MTIQAYLNQLQVRYQTGISREHTYRGDLQTLLMTILPDILVTNEPARVACGAPDYMLTRKDVPVGYIEAKDIGVDLASKTLKEQLDRYRSGLSNLIFTDYLDFHFYKDGAFVTSIAIARLTFPSNGGVAEGRGGQIVPIPENFATFEALIKNFALTISQTIKSPTKLAEMMAGKAKLMADVIEKSLNHDDETDIRSSLKSQMLSFKQMLIHDINNSAFADIYAQTIAYGMFAARYHDPTLPTFSRQEAATLIPKSNPFLRKLFQDIAGYDLDDRLVWMVDELVNIFLATDVADIMQNFGKSTKQEDPVVHFYETFLAAYNPALRKARGVWYTPQPVVNFIVRAVDDILKTEFNLPQGLADTSKIKVKTKTVTKATADQRSKLKEVEIEQEVHRVQILDPATGTGTFLAEVVKHIYKKFEGQQGIWSNYVNQHLIPRLNGFELLMASYAMAHLKMDMLLTETGYKATTDQRFRIFLTNSLEEAHPDTGTLFSSWLSDEADQANAIKRETPVMVIMGNPPYAVSSANKGEWIEKLTADYKKDLNERNIQPLSDDYIKFIRFGQYFIDKNGEGVLAYISNNSFIDGIIHRQMRKHLLESFDKIYIIDLHGNAKKQEFCPDGSPDQNVFDIMQGVSINLFIKTNKKKKNEYGEVFHYDLQGKRDFKYDFLKENFIASIDWKKYDVKSPDFKYSKVDYQLKLIYENNFSLKDIFVSNNVGFTAARDSSLIHFEKSKIKELLFDIETLGVEEIRNKYNFGVDSRDWTIKGAVDDIKSKNDRNITRINYRPFDFRYSHYSQKTKGFFSYPRWEIMKHFHENDNIGLIATRLNRQQSLGYFWISNSIIERHILDTAGDSTSFFPLYLYPDPNNQKTNKQTTIDTQTSIDQQTARVPNLNMEIVNQIAAGLGLKFTAEKAEAHKAPSPSERAGGEEFAPIDLLDYIYAVLHSPAYREKYKEFLKIDFPRVPYPGPLTPKGGIEEVQAKFWELVKLGGQLRQLHLLESEETEKYITEYPIDGDNVVTKIRFEINYTAISGDMFTLLDPVYPMGRVYINETQFFQMVPEAAWNFYIGGYQPAQKWLKDRKGRTLEFEDILHYQKIIVALQRTSELMVEIDKVMGE